MNIVLVEDSERIRVQLRKLLDTLPGVRVVGEASTEQDGIELIEQLKPDLVLLDLHLKYGNGMNVLEAVRTAGVNSKVFVLTTQPAPAYRELCIALGAADYFDKTADMSRLMDVLRLISQAQVKLPMASSEHADYADEAIDGHSRRGVFARIASWIVRGSTGHAVSRSALASVAIVCALAITSTSARAVVATNSFQVTANVSSSCTVSGSTLNFGTGIDPIAAAVPLNAASALSVRCTNTTPYAIALDAGVNAGGSTSFSTRKIANGVNTLGYQLYTDSSRTTVWGNGTGSSTSSGTGTGSTQSVSIYGQLPSLVGAVPGTYTDTVTVTISY